MLMNIPKSKSKLLSLIILLLIVIASNLNMIMIYNNDKSRKLGFNLSISNEIDSWTHTWNYGGHTIGFSIANDSSDNIYVLGCSLQGGYIIKYNNSGELISYQVINLLNIDPYEIIIDSSDNIYISGMLDNRSIFLFKYDNAGNPKWNHSFGDVCLFGGIALDSSDNIYLAYTNYNSTSSEVCIVKFNNSGDEIWNLKVSDYLGDEITGIKIDSNDNIFLSIVDWEDNNALLTKYNNIGVQLWNYTLNDLYTNSFTLDSSDNAIIANMNTLVKLNNDGNQLWNQTLHRGYLLPHVLITDSLNNIYVAENREKHVYDNLLFIECMCYENAIYLEKFNSNGGLLGEKRCTGCNDARCNDMVIDSQGNLFLCGSTNQGIFSILIMKNPSEFTGQCYEIYYDLIALIIVGSVVALIIVVIRFRRRR